MLKCIQMLVKLRQFLNDVIYERALERYLKCHKECHDMFQKLSFFGLQF